MSGPKTGPALGKDSMQGKWKMSRASRISRSKNGHAISEFSAAFVFFVCFVLVPLIDFGFVPLRYLISQGVLNEATHRLSLSQKRSEAYNLLDGDFWWRNFLDKCGVTVADTSMNLLVCGQSASDSMSCPKDSTLAADWLPGGSKGPCIYSIEVTTTCEIAPLFHGSAGLPGFTSPVPITLKSRSQWENLGRDPQTGAYYINE